MYIIIIRCQYTTFIIIYNLVEKYWLAAGLKVPHWNTVFSIKEHVAVTLYYFGSTGAIHEAGNLFGMSKTRTYIYIDQVRKVLTLCLSPIFIQTPTTDIEWFSIADGFE